MCVCVCFVCQPSVCVPWIGDQHFLLLASGEEWHLEVIGVCEVPT